MSVYRRGAVYWWVRRVKLDTHDPRSIMLRMSLKTSDKAEARSRALALDTELQMVALRFPKQAQPPSQEALEAVYKEALAYKRDQIASIQSRPPFDFAQHRRYNAVYAHLSELLARSPTLPVSDPAWNEAADDPALEEGERELFLELAEHHGLSPATPSSQAAAPGPVLPLVAPRVVLNCLQNAEIADTPENRRMVLTAIASAYHEAFVAANAQIDAGDFTANLEFLPQEVRDLLTPHRHSQKEEPPPSPQAPFASGTEAPEHGTTSQARENTSSTLTQSARSELQPGSNLIDLTISELAAEAIRAKTTSKDWQETAARNAKVIADIFIAVNGDLRMSEIETGHVYALRDRLDIMPTIWGKSKEDREGGFQAVFTRGEMLAQKWKADPVKAKQNSVPKVGFAVPTFDRHILTLKQLFDFARGLEDASGAATHIFPSARFANLVRKDKRKKNSLTPVPSREEMRVLLSGPVHLGCAGPDDRFNAGDMIVHDSLYWGPLILAVYGPRSNEFCQMPLHHVMDKAPVPFFRIRAWEGQTTKTPATNRDLPIAPELLLLGFLNYVQVLREKGEFWLFPELNLTGEKPRKVFLEDNFRPLVTSLFPDGTSAISDGKEIDTKSLRKFAATFLRTAIPKIDVGIRQAFFGHERKTTLEVNYEDDPTVEELLPCVTRMQELISHLDPHPISLRSSVG
jgi:hypothetical protein